MCDLNYRRGQIDKGLVATVERLAKTMVELVTDCNGNVNIRSLRNVFNSMKFSDGEYDDFSSDIEEEKYVEDESENENEFEDDSEPKFDIYPLEEEEFVYGEMGTVIIDEPLFDVYTLKDEFVSGVEEIDMDDEPVFDKYPIEEEFVFGGKEIVIVGEPIFDRYPSEEECMTKDIIEVDYENETIFEKSYEQLVERAKVQEMTAQEASLHIEDSIIFITQIDFSVQIEKKINEISTLMVIDGKFSIQNKASVGELWPW